MGKIAFIFPGQGSQEVGMGQDLAQEYKVVAETFKQADKELGFDIEELIFNGPEAELKETENTQPAILTTSVAIYRLLIEQGVGPDLVAGHSLGEYSALVAAGVLEFADAVKLVRTRGLLMRDADPEGEGSMAAVIGLTVQDIEEVCQKASQDGIVEVANYNCPGQTVISGDQAGIKQAIKLAKEQGAKRAIPLNVSGAFHSSLMNQAGDKLAEELEKIALNRPEIPIITNVDAALTEDQTAVKEALVKQISGSVRWTESIEAMIEAGVDTFIEVGPGRVLKSFMRRIDRSVTALNVADIKSLEKTLKKL